MPHSREWVEVYALIRSARGEYLIVRSGMADDDRWRFVGGPIIGHASPESRIVEVAREQVDVRIAIQQAQPPFVYNFGTHTIRYRCFLCLIAERRAIAAGVPELRRIRPMHLHEHFFDAPTAMVIDWLLDSSRG
ncbi:MAG: hypothetical protein ACKVS9_07790 [Phycisphaerae bacterium]